MQLFAFRKNQVKILFWATLILISCHRSDEVPPPEDFSGYPQPVTRPLELTTPAPLHWDTLAKGVIKPAVFPLDFSKLKGFPYDSSGFKPLPEPPTTSQFNFSSLPTRAFDLEKVEAHSLDMKTQVLPKPPASVTLEIPSRVAAATMDIRDWQQIAKLNLYIREMQLDRSGILWLATSKGIYSFDGALLTNVLPGFMANGLLFDKEDNLWTMDMTNQSQTTFVKINFKNKTVERSTAKFKFGSIARLVMDKEGSIWVSGVGTPAPMVINSSNLTYRMLDTKTGFNSSRYFYPSIDHFNRIWYGSRNGIEIIDNKEKKVYHITSSNGLMADTVTAMISDKDGTIWAANRFGVDAISPTSGTITHYVLTRKGNKNAYRLLLDKTGQLWICNQNGPDIINPGNNTYRHTGIVRGINNGLVTDIVEYKTGQIVFAGTLNNTSFHSLYSIDQYGKTVHPFGTTPINTTVEDSKGNLWVGTDTGLLVVNSLRNRFYKLNVKDGLSNPIIQSVTEQQGKVVITTNDGYNIFDPDKNELRRINQKDGLVTDFVYSLMTDNDGNEWIEGNSKGIIKYDAANHLFMKVDMNGGLNGNTIIQTLNIGNNKIVTIPADGGPAIIDVQKNTIQTIKDSGYLNNFTYKGSMFDSRGRLWVCGSIREPNFGLYLVNFPNNVINHFTTREGLPDNMISSVLEYNGKILAGANQKVVMITPPELSANKLWSTAILANSENLKKNTTSYVSDAVTKKGNYIWGDDGLSIIYGLHADTTSADVEVKNITVMGTDLTFIGHRISNQGDSAQKKKLKSLSAAGYITGGDLRWDSLIGPYHLPVNLSLPYNQNVIQFHFGEISAERSDSVYYAYVLEGIDKKWTKTIKPETATYLNLPPGDYTFKVASLWRNGKWNKPAVFSFTIRPPWYLTWWAYTLYILLGLGLLRLYIVIRSRKLMQENKMLEEKVNQRTKELQQSYNNVEKLEEIGKKITSTLSVEKIIGTVYDNVNGLMDANVFGIGIYNDSLKRIEFPATYEEGKQLPFYTNSVDDENRFAPVCFNSNKEVIIGNLGEEYKKYIQKIETPHEGEQPLSLIFLPLVAKDKKLGVITVQSFKKDAYTDYHLYMLRNIAIYAAIAIENATSYEDLKTTQKQLIQSEKMASLGELTAGIAHEIQNPLNFVNNFSEVSKELLGEMKEAIEKGKTDDAKAIMKDVILNLEKINHHGKRADSIVKGMLMHSRSSTGQKELTDINALCDEYLRLAYHGLRAKDKSFNAKFETDFDPSLPKINVVPQDMGRVILNLINNAFYAVNEKAKSLMPNAGGFEPTVVVSTKYLGDKVEVKVKDNGNGIPDKIKDKIFQPFFTTKPTGQGTGLGLSLSYDIITKGHGGQLKVETKESEFTKFVINLPV